MSDIREKLEGIQKVAESASSLTRKLLNFARKEKPTPMLVDLNAIVHDVIIKPFSVADIRKAVNRALDPQG